LVKYIYVSGKRFKVVPKPRSIFGDYVALHGFLTDRDLPHNLRKGKIPRYEIWMREDIYNDKIKRNLTLIHEEAELKRMMCGMKYKDAHRIADMADGFW
jgi:hypothetical protein